MGCCDDNPAFRSIAGKTSAELAPPDLSRRSVLKGVAALAGVVSAAGPAAAQTNLKKVTVSFCSQILCAPPYVVGVAGGHFRNYGLDVEIVYTRGGNAAIQALVEREVETATRWLAPHEKIRKMTLLEREFTMDSGELTPTHKIKRRVVEDRLRDQIEEMYNQPATAAARSAGP